MFVAHNIISMIFLIQVKVSTLQMTPSLKWMLLATFSVLDCCCQTTSSKARVCVPGTTARTFPSLIDYQGTKISFDPDHPGYEGNIVEFSFHKIDRLPKNTFISFGSDSIYKISLDHKQILYIDDGAFLGLFCLHELDLSYNNISSLSEDVFEGLANLRKLSFRHNQLKEFPDASKLYHLNTLDLSSNEITALKRLPALPELSSLNLSFNKISAIKSNAFVNLTSLTELLLNNNNLGWIEPDQWVGLGNLRTLNLAANYLRSFDTSGHFSFSNLTDLNLSSNYLTDMNTYYLKMNFPKLTKLDVRQNYWNCLLLDAFFRGIKDTKIIPATPVNCSEVSITPTIRAQTTTSTTPKSTPSSTTKVPEYLRDIKSQNKLILLSNTNIKDTLVDLYYILVFICIILVGFITFETLFKLGICSRRYMRLSGHLDSDGAERVLLRG